MIFRLNSIQDTQLYKKVTSGEHHQFTATKDNNFCKKGETINVHNPMYFLIQDDFYNAEWKLKLMNQVEAFLLDDNKMIMLQELNDNFQ